MGSITPAAPPVIDFSPFYGNDESEKQKLVDQVRDACLAKGFFQIINHNIPNQLQEDVLEATKQLFDLPMEEKMKVEKSKSPHNRGYESLRAQNFEHKAEGDLKEGYYFGTDLSPTHPLTGRFNMGPNLYPSPTSFPTPTAHESFITTIDNYHASMTKLAESLLSILARTLSLPPTYFSTSFTTNPIATLRLLHYPPQAPTASPDERGCGAHTDFGAITLLLQDTVGGLQVYDYGTNTWIDVEPTPGAFVVNLGNMMMRWTNDRYVSNLHRVINKSGKERYSVPFFFSGNVDYVVECLPGCEGNRGRDGETGKERVYEPVKVEDYMRGRYVDTYGGKDGEKGIADMVREEVKR